jgi:hypothetical protein
MDSQLRKIGAEMAASLFPTPTEDLRPERFSRYDRLRMSKIGKEFQGNSSPHRGAMGRGPIGLYRESRFE